MATASANPPYISAVFDAATGETVTRELTPEEIAALPEAAKPGEATNE